MEGRAHADTLKESRYPGSTPQALKIIKSLPPAEQKGHKFCLHLGSPSTSRFCKGR